MSIATPSLEARPRGPGLWDRVRTLWQRRETIRYLTAAGLKAGHRDKLLGHLWNILDPLMFMLVYFFVFGVLFGLSGGGRSIQFMLYVLSGVLIYQFFSASVAQATNCIRANRGLIHEINFPKAVFPLSVVFARLYDFCWGLVVLVVFLLLARLWPTGHYAWLPLLLVLSVLFVIGTAFIVAYLGAFFADTANVVNVALRLLFYCSPIFYYVRPKPGIPEKLVFLHDKAAVHFIYMLNPITCMLECYRDALMWGQNPEPRLLIYFAAVAVGICLAGFALFCRGEGKFAKYV